MKIKIEVLGGNFSSETITKGKVLAKKQLTSRTTTTLIGDQEPILSGLSLLNNGTVMWKFINSSNRRITESNPTLDNLIIHSCDAANFGLANKINEAYN